MPTNIHRAIVAAPIGNDANPLRGFIESQNEEIQRLFKVGGETHNFFNFICMLPDGSDEGRAASCEAAEARAEFKNLLNQIGCDWVEVTFGDVDYKISDMDASQKEIETDKKTTILGKSLKQIQDEQKPRWGLRNQNYVDTFTWDRMTFDLYYYAFGPNLKDCTVELQYSWHDRHPLPLSDLETKAKEHEWWKIAQDILNTKIFKEKP